MKTDGSNYLTTGEFAKLCQVKKQTLFHYDDIDLLRPGFVDDNGYRFYSIQQYETFIVISSLKEVGMTLNQIKRYLNEPSSELRLATMNEALEKLTKKVAYLNLTRRMLGNEINRAHEAEHLDVNTIAIETLPARKLVRSRMLDKLNDKELIVAVTEYAATVEVVCAALKMDDINTLEYSRYVFLLANEIEEYKQSGLETARNRRHFIPYVRPAGNYVVAYHKGSYEQAGETYERILAFMKERGIRAGIYAYEEYLRNEITAATPDDYLTRISIQTVS
ncbi:MAG: MerR family transcriptional regulator [Actinobacteria bacterium]|nr:MerR family transcriptional regulator [Actinomycetota bacterium]